MLMLTGDLDSAPGDAVGRGSPTTSAWQTALIEPLSEARTRRAEQVEHAPPVPAARRAEQPEDQFEASRAAVVASLVRALTARDGGTGNHVNRVRSYSLLIGRALGFSSEALRMLDMGAALHDVGKIGIPDAILNKPGPLTDAELAIMRTHVEIGYQIVADVPFLAPAAPVVAHHHERWDGTGYPDRLAGPAIPLAARIVAVADAFDAMTSDRPYRSALPVDAALFEIEAGRGSQLDPDAADVLLRCLRGMARRF